jgi:hypothetical protein
MKISSFTIDHILSAQSMITFHYWSFVVIIIRFEQHWYHCHNFIFISFFNWTNINFISNSMNFSENIKSQMTFASLNVEELITLKNEVAKKYEISLEKKKKRRTKNDNEYILEYFVRYLNSITHFFISKSSIACLTCLTATLPTIVTFLLSNLSFHLVVVSDDDSNIITYLLCDVSRS